MFQAKTGHPSAFKEALQKLRGEESDISKEAAEIKVSTFNCLRVRIDY